MVSLLVGLDRGCSDQAPPCFLQYPLRKGNIASGSTWPLGGDHYPQPMASYQLTPNRLRDTSGQSEDFWISPLASHYL